MSTNEHTIGFVGAGVVATSLALGMSGAGYRVGAVSSRSRASADALTTLVEPQPRVHREAQAVADACDTLFITTPDDAIADTAASIEWQPHHRVIHCSGALTTDALEGARKAGASVGSFHPLHPFTRGAASLEGSAVGIEADGPLAQWLEVLASDLGCSSMRIRSEDKALYHLSAGFVSSFVVTMLNAATQVWGSFGIPKDQAREALLPLLRGAVRNIETVGVPDCLTGPISRGDVETVRKHLDELGARAPALLPAYRELASLTVPVAQEKGNLDDGSAGELKRMLEVDRNPASVQTL
jgi:predicted short-subunit dehydrogenase-like oxidoreductase (DUF2520 family)